MKLELLSTDKAPGAVGPYSQGSKGNGFIFTSGQLPIVPETGKLLKGDIQKETRQSLENVLAVVKAGGGKLEDIAKVNIFITDMEQFSLVNEVYEEYFSDHKPARCCVEVSKLPAGGDIEIEAIAVL